MCKAPVTNLTILWGRAGAAPAVDHAAWGLHGMYTNGYCAFGYGTFWAGPRFVYLLNLGESTPLGGTLTVTTCGTTANNTVLYVGTGCPTWAAPFGCLKGNDDAGDVAGQACPTNAAASTVTLRSVSQRTYYVQVAGFAGATVVSGLRWEYVPPPAQASPSGSRTRTATRSRYPSPTRSRTRTRSRSGSRKPKL
jgi:hypothetical protein